MLAAQRRDDVALEVTHVLRAACLAVCHHQGLEAARRIGLRHQREWSALRRTAFTSTCAPDVWQTVATGGGTIAGGLDDEDIGLGGGWQLVAAVAAGDDDVLAIGHLDAGQRLFARVLHAVAVGVVEYRAFHAGRRGHERGAGQQQASQQGLTHGVLGGRMGRCALSPCSATGAWRWICWDWWDGVVVGF
ncbi:hypothetical protein D3C71_706350 [compost metagenome]